MADKRTIRAEADRLRALFEASGAVPVDPAILMPAEALLDLYGEDIRARAYVTADPLRGEQMLRPDFTLPVVLAHLAGGATETGAGAARYCYAGEVFRRQEEAEPGRPNEFLQVGLELLGGADPAADEAEVFALIAGALAPLGLRAAIGDIGLLRAAVEGLATTAPRRAALLRHLWRPPRFRALIDRYAGRAKPTPGRLALLARLDAEPAAALIAAAGAMIGLRSASEIAERLEALRAEAATPPLSPAETDLLDDLLAVRAAPVHALARLRDLAVDLAAIEPAVDRFEARLQALDRRGVDISALEFEASYGRTTLEYYDGFVFGLYAEGRAELPAVASGGRYDALTRALGNGSAVPAVGGVIRPGLALALGEGRA